MIGPAVLRGVMLLKYLGAGKCHGLTMEGPNVPSEAPAPRGLGLRRGAIAPPQYWVWGLCPRKFKKKINVEITHFQAFLQAKKIIICSVGNASKIRHSILT